MKNRMDALEKSQTKNRNRLDALEKEQSNEEIKKRLGAIENTQARLTRKSAFSVETADPYYPSTPYIVRYNFTLFNEGNHFSMSTGKYIAPFDGIYYFSLSIVSPYGKNAYASIKRNGGKKAEAMAMGGGNGEYEVYASASTSEVMRLSQGDQVYVYCRNRLASYGAKFTGHLI